MGEEQVLDSTSSSIMFEKEGAKYLVRETALVPANLAAGERHEEVEQRVVEAHGVLL